MSDSKKTLVETALTGVFTTVMSYWLWYLTYSWAIKSVSATLVFKTFMYVIGSILAGFGSLLCAILTFVMFCFLLYGIFEEIIKG